MEKINIVELLKDCPTGMELDCTIYENVTLRKIDTSSENEYPIQIETKQGYLLNLTRYGTYTDIEEAKCVIFPKGKTTWEGFQRPFNDGDVLVHTQNERFIMSIYKSNENERLINTYVIFWDREEGLSVGMQINCYNDNVRFATEEEKQKLFDAIKANGYKWNAETKTLKKLPKFKVGDRIKKKGIDDIDAIEIAAVGQTIYTFKGGNWQSVGSVDKEYELVPNKFDITTLKPFESKVLVRNTDGDLWKPAIYGLSHSKGCYAVGGVYWGRCIPYEGNEYLLGTGEDCKEFYKTWKE